MKIIILSGFLGAGKTTVLLQLARDLVNDPGEASSCKVMVLENEIGEAGIDGEFLAGKGMQVRNLFAGCVCCSLAGELLDAVHQIEEEFSPDWLIIETTGAAVPGPVRVSLLQAFGIKAWIFTVVDAKRWKRLYLPMKTLLERQLEEADLVLINKVNQVSLEEAKEVEACVREIAGKQGVRIYRMNALEPVNPCIWEILEEKNA